MALILRRGFLVALTFIFLTFGVTDVFADEIDSEALAEARELLKAGREDLVREELHLTESEAAAFWPV